MARETKLKVLLVDDHPIVRKGLKSLINEQPDMEVVADVGDGRSALALAKELQPDVLVLDFSLPDMNGARLMERIQEVCSHVLILTLTIHEGGSYLRQMLHAGAMGYLLKSAVESELIHAIRTVGAGRPYLDPKLAAKVANTLVSYSSSSGKERVPTGRLSEREREVLRQIALGYSNKEIAAQLSVSPKTVETYKARMADKLDLHSRVDLVRYALQQGWLNEA